MTRKTGTMLAKTAGQDTCGYKFGIAEDAGGFVFCCGMGSVQHQYHVPVRNGAVIPSKQQSYCWWPKPIPVTVWPTIFAIREIEYYYCMVKCVPSKRCPSMLSLPMNP
jgi:hypothetical protein